MVCSNRFFPFPYMATCTLAHQNNPNTVAGFPDPSFSTRRGDIEILPSFYLEATNTLEKLEKVPKLGLLISLLWAPNSLRKSLPIKPQLGFRAAYPPKLRRWMLRIERGRIGRSGLTSAARARRGWRIRWKRNWRRLWAITLMTPSWYRSIYKVSILLIYSPLVWSVKFLLVIY